MPQDGSDVASIDPHERPKLTGAGVLAVTAAGVTAAALLPGTRPGLGIFLVAVLITVAVAIAGPRQIGTHEVVFGGLTLMLAAMSFVRVADWLIVIDVVAAVALASYVATRGVTWAATLGAPLRVLGASRWVPIEMARPVLDRVRRRGVEGYPTLVRTSGISLALVVVFGALFVSADAAFAQLTNELLVPDLELTTVSSRVVVFVLSAMLAGALALARFLPRTGESEGTTGWSWSSSPSDGGERKVIEWLFPIATLDLLFAVFVGIQATVLFGGQQHVEVTPGLTYAEYARQGFFQLLAVAALVLIVVAITVRVARPATTRDQTLARLALGVLCTLTLVILASAWYRLGVYEDVYGLSRLRVSVYATIAWLGCIFGVVMIAGAVWKGSWLPRVTVAVTAVGLVVFNVVNPDRLIADRNVARFDQNGTIDVSYLAGLSEDAVPALLELPAEVRECVLSRLALSRGTSEDRGWKDFNIARNSARTHLTELDVPVRPDPSCFS